MIQHNSPEETIVALATPTGVSAIAVIRLSGKDAINIVEKVFQGKSLKKVKSHTIHLGAIVDGHKVIDEVLVSVFHEPHSYTGENAIEISCHGSPLIAAAIIKLLIREGAKPAHPGDFTKRAFLNGKLDLTQAEAVADLIHAENENARKTAINQMKGGFSKELTRLRNELIHFASLVELELDFGEEDVEFAKRDDLRLMILNMLSFIIPMIESFDRGNVIKNGVGIVIAGKPNVGKSTLLNALLNEEKAIVSEIPGTTRDIIEDVVHLEGITLRFLDTAGLRKTNDLVEAIGVERAVQQMKVSSLILYVVDTSNTTLAQVQEEVESLKQFKISYFLVGNKMDQADQSMQKALEKMGVIFISAKQGKNLHLLKEKIISLFKNMELRPDELVITNVRHHTNLLETKAALERVIQSLEQKISGDFLAMDIRQALHYLGELTGEITTEDLLENIFSKFCIGK